MPQHKETCHFPYSVQQLFDLVADVANYPEFLPWCVAARITGQTDDGFLADLVIRFKHITESYTSRVRLSPPDTTSPEAQILVELVKGPFSHLSNRWHFAPDGQGGCHVHFMLDFSFKTKLLDSLIGGLFGRATEKMVGAFSRRADDLYGTSHPASN